MQEECGEVIGIAERIDVDEVKRLEGGNRGNRYCWSGDSTGSKPYFEASQ
jgi:hypothetical protein